MSAPTLDTLKAAAAAALLAGAAATVSAQTPAPSRVYAIEHARIVTLAGPIIESGTIVIRDGRIAAVGASVPLPAGATRIDGKGLHVYPGFFDAVTELGLTEVGQGASGTVDTNETGGFNPQLVAASAVHPSSEIIPVTRANGITHAVAVPGLASSPFGNASVIGGQASAISLAGWSVEDMLIQPSVGVLVNWPRLTTGTFDLTTLSQRSRPYSEVKQEYDKRVTELGDWIERTRRYAQAREQAAASTERDLKLEALVPVIQGKAPLLINAAEKRQIRDAIAFCADRKLRMVLLGGDQALAQKDALLKHRIPVILGPTQSLPGSDDEPYDEAYTRAARLTDAGIEVSISTFNAADSRTLPYEAGHAVGFGLPWEQALRAVTVNPAKALGLADRVGTLEPGKLANLIVTTGDPLEITTEVKHLFIAGAPVSLDNKHQRSYEHWRSRPRPVTGTK